MTIPFGEHEPLAIAPDTMGNTLDVRSREQALRLAKVFEQLTTDQREYAVKMFEDYADHICRCRESI